MKKYALKIENIFEKDTVKSLASPVWRKNDFAETLSKLYPNHFMTLYGYKIGDKCEHLFDPSIITVTGTIWNSSQDFFIVSSDNNWVVLGVLVTADKHLNVTFNDVTLTVAINNTSSINQ